jgi:BhlA holin family
MFKEVMQFFINTQSPWAILFVFLLGYIITTNARRETERRNELKEFRQGMEKDLDYLKQNTHLMLETWKIIIQRELDRRKK